MELNSLESRMRRGRAPTAADAARGSEAILAVKRAIVLLAIVAAVWAFTLTITWAQDASTSGNGQIVITPGSLYMMIGVCALVVPLTAWVTRLAVQVAAHDRRFERIDSRNEDLIRKGVEVGERLARGMENLADGPGAGRISDPNRGRF